MIKEDGRSRIQEAAVSADALLPGGPYDLWREGEESHRVRDLVNAFAQRAHLPKMLNRRAIVETLVGGCEQGIFVLRLTRPDKSGKTFWKQAPDDVALQDPTLEVVLPEAAELTELSPGLLSPGTLPELWKNPTVAVKDVLDYFAGGRVVKVARDGWEEPMQIPRAEAQVVESAIEQAVREGRLWLITGPASVFKEDVPAGILTQDAILQAPPESLSPMSIIPDALSQAWTDETTTGLAISVAISKERGKTLPWVTVSEAIAAALRTRILERTEESGPWPCDLSDARRLKLRVPETTPPPPLPPPPPGTRITEAAAVGGLPASDGWSGTRPIPPHPCGRKRCPGLESPLAGDSAAPTVPGTPSKSWR